MKIKKKNKVHPNWEREVENNTKLDRQQRNNENHKKSAVNDLKDR
jgi:hypothetical protein